MSKKIKLSISVGIFIVIGLLVGANIALARSPSVSIDADDTSIDYNQSTTIRWDSTYADECNAAGGDNGWSGTVNTSGSFNTGSLGKTTTFFIYCTNEDGSGNDLVTVYVDESSIELDVSTDKAANVKKDSAILNGSVEANTKQNITAWFEWGTNSNSYQNKTRKSTYTSVDSQVLQYTLKNLSASNIYYFRAVAENDRGEIFYGEQKNFTTKVDSTCGFYSCTEDAPDVTTLDATKPNDTYTYAVFNGYVDTHWGSTITWFEWGTTKSSLTYNTVRVSHGTVSGNFNQMIPGLSPNTTYYFRAVAQGSGNPVYGNILSFTTISNVPPTYTPPQNITPITIPITTSTATLPTITIPVKINPIVSTPVTTPAPTPTPTAPSESKTESPAKSSSTPEKTEKEAGSLLQGTALLFGDNFLPSSLMEWMFLLLLIALFLLLAKKAYIGFPPPAPHTEDHK